MSTRAFGDVSVIPVPVSCRTLLPPSDLVAPRAKDRGPVQKGGAPANPGTGGNERPTPLFSGSLFYLGRLLLQMEELGKRNLE